MNHVKTRHVGRTWFTSELLLGSEYAAGERGFRSAREMNEFIVNQWNELVTANDVVWILGNLAASLDRDDLDPLRQVTRLNGTKYLLAGPLDRCLVGRYPYASKAAIEYRELAGLKAVITGREFIADNPPARRQVPVQIPLLGGPSHGHMNVVLSPFHYADPGAENDDYAAYRPRWEKRRAGQSPYLVHGEADWVIKDYPPGKSVNVGMDAWGYVPVSAEMVADLLREDEN